MYVMMVSGILLLIAAAYLGVGAYRLDHELRRLLPSRMQWRWMTDRRRRDSPLADQVHILFLQCIPPHWRQQLHAERGAGLAGRLYLFLGLAWCFALIGLALLARVIGTAA